MAVYTQKKLLPTLRAASICTIRIGYAPRGAETVAHPGQDPDFRVAPNNARPDCTVGPQPPQTFILCVSHWILIGKWLDTRPFDLCFQRQQISLAGGPINSDFLLQLLQLRFKELQACDLGLAMVAQHIAVIFDLVKDQLPDGGRAGLIHRRTAPQN